MATDCLTEKATRETASSPLREYVRLLRNLHALIAQGKGDSGEADQLRDLMDDPWYQMSPDEIRRVRGLSADLYTLVDPPSPPQAADPREIAETCRLVEAAWNNKDWDGGLELLRDRPHPYPADRVAFMRAGCWEHLGDLETSRLFLEKAVSLSPSNGYYRIGLLYTLLRLGRLTEAISLADRILGVPDVLHPDLLYKMAGALIGSIHALEDVGQKQRVIAKAAESIQKALQNEGLLPEGERTTSSSVAGHVNLGMCYRLLGKEDLALMSYNAALALDPDNDAALVGRGLLRLRSDQAAAIEDFQKAAHGSSLYVWPQDFHAFPLIASG
jgi:tetratricopeptide (TPR) repeat protein